MFSFRTTALEDQLDKALLDGRVGCFCTQNCWDTAHGRYMYDLFTERGNLKAVFSPMGAELTPGTNHISFDAEALTELDAIVVEIQDAGARYFNYTKDVFHLMVILAVMENPPSLYIVDHINPAGRIVEGSMPSGTVEPHTPKSPTGTDSPSASSVTYGTTRSEPHSPFTSSQPWPATLPASCSRGR